MDKKIKNKFGPAFAKHFDDPEFKKDYEKEYKELALSELILAIMEGGQISIKKLVEAAEVSPTTIKDLRSGKKGDVKFSSFLSIVEACGYGLELVKGDKRISLSNQKESM